MNKNTIFYASKSKKQLYYKILGYIFELSSLGPIDIMMF